MSGVFASVRVGAWSGRLRPGDVVGRLQTSAVPLHDPHISEAHALLSQRAGELWLLSLRGRLKVQGRVMPEVRLRPGLEVALSPTSTLLVEDVAVPAFVLGLSAPGVPAHAPLGVVSLTIDADLASLRVTPGLERDAAATVWVDDDALIVHRPGHPVEALGVDDVVSVGSVPLRCVRLDRAGHDMPATERGGLAEALTITARYESLELARQSAPPVVLGGLMARVVGEVIALGGSARWDLVAENLWRDADVGQRRQRWDAMMARLRRTLRAHGLRDDLLVQLGTGEVSLKRYPGDVVVDEL